MVPLPHPGDRVRQAADAEREPAPILRECRTTGDTAIGERGAAGTPTGCAARTTSSLVLVDLAREAIGSAVACPASAGAAGAAGAR